MKRLSKLLLKESRGFTLIELIVVVAILGVLAAVLVPTISGYITDAKTNAANANAQTVYTAVQMVIAEGTDVATGTTSETDSTAEDAITAIVGDIPDTATWTVTIVDDLYYVTYADTASATGYYPNDPTD